MIDYFYAEAIEDRPGCYYIHWDLHDADAAYLNEQGVTAPGDGETCEPGTYTLRAENAQGSVEETLTITADGQIDEPTTQPDLEIREVVTTPNPNNPNRVRVEIRVANNGNAPTAPFTIRWFPHRSEDVMGCSVDASGLAAHDSGRARCSYTYPNHGEMHWMAVVDQDNEIVESDDDNNTYTGLVVIERSGQQDEPEGEGQGVEQDDQQGSGAGGNKPDLVIENAHFEPDPVVKGQPFEAVMVVRNDSQVPVTEPFSALWHFHASLGLEDCVWQLDQGIDPGASKRLFCERTTNAGPGQAPTAPTVDTDNVIDESDEINNDVSVPMSIVVVSEDFPDPSAGGNKPDLVIEDAHYEPDPVVKGQPFEAVMVVRNDSQVLVTEPFEVMWNFSTLLGLEDCVWQVEQGIAPGASKRLVCERTTNAEAGNFFAAINMNNNMGDAIAESDYSNNGVAVYMSVVIVAQDHPDPSASGKPDLTIGDLQVSPNPVKPTGSLSIKYTVVNQSQVPAEPSQAEWRSKDAGFSFLCEVPQLAGGASHTCEHVVPVLPGVGSYHSQAIADVGGSVDEYDEHNNRMKQPFKIQP